MGQHAPDGVPDLADAAGRRIVVVEKCDEVPNQKTRTTPMQCCWKKFRSDGSLWGCTSILFGHRSPRAMVAG